MNKCQFLTQTIKRMANSGGDIIKDAWDLSAVYADMQATVTANSGLTNVEGTPVKLRTAGSGEGYNGLILAPNGCIYSVPALSGYILKIDTSSDSVTTIGLGEQGLCFKGCLATDGKIYMAPSGDGRKIWILDPATDAVTYISDSKTTGNAGAFCGSDGTVFIYAGSGSNWTAINTRTGDYTHTVPSINGGDNSRRARAMTPSGELVTTSYGGAYNFILWDYIPTWRDVVNNTPVTRSTITNSGYDRINSITPAANGYLYCTSVNGGGCKYSYANHTISSATTPQAMISALSYDGNIYTGQVGLKKYDVTSNNSATIVSGGTEIYGLRLYGSKLYYLEEKGDVYMIPLTVNQEFKLSTLLSPLVNIA